MAQTVLITLTTAGADTDNFSLYSNVDGYVTAFATGITRAALIAGYTSTVVPDGTTTIRIKSNSTCVNYVDLAVGGITTTTTAAPTTTTTTSAPPARSLSLSNYSVAFDQFGEPCVPGADFINITASEAWYTTITSTIDGNAVVPGTFISPNTGTGNVTGAHIFAGSDGEVAEIQFFWTSDNAPTGATFTANTNVPGLQCG